MLVINPPRNLGAGRLQAVAIFPLLLSCHWDQLTISEGTILRLIVRVLVINSSKIFTLPRAPDILGQDYRLGESAHLRLVESFT